VFGVPCRGLGGTTGKQKQHTVAGLFGLMGCQKALSRQCDNVFEREVAGHDGDGDGEGTRGFAGGQRGN
jgi:hypothetical protein